MYALEEQMYNLQDDLINQSKYCKDWFNPVTVFKNHWRIGDIKFIGSDDCVMKAEDSS